MNEPLRAPRLQATDTDQTDMNNKEFSGSTWNNHKISGKVGEPASEIGQEQSPQIMPQTQTPQPPPRSAKTAACDTDSVIVSSQNAGPASHGGSLVARLLHIQSPDPSDG